jgi:Fe-S-cluster-containing hydrogenase component 2
MMERRYIFCDPDKCTGCRICELVCSAVKEGRFDQELSRIRVAQPSAARVTSIACRFCENAPCINACPRDALTLEETTQTIKLDKARCTGCGWCIEACDFGAISLDRNTKSVVLCDLCHELEQPMCVAICPKEALTLSTPNIIAQKTRDRWADQETK